MRKKEAQNSRSIKEGVINPLSYASIPISMYLEETKQKLASATAFIYEHNERFYLITNWHNLTGLNPITKKNIGNHAGIPDILSISLQVQEVPFIKWKAFTIKLYEDNKAVWLIHPIHKELVDVVAIELKIPENFEGIIRPINKIKFDNFNLEISDDIFILGYPYSFTGGGQFPIWKRGSVATEPDIDYENLPKFFVDTASKSGMSGAPVIFKRIGVHGLVNGQPQPDTIFGEISGFVGIYAGRVTGKSELDAQLGVVWKKEVIEKIIEGNLEDERNFI